MNHAGTLLYPSCGLDARFDHAFMCDDAYVRGLATHMEVVRSTSTKYLDGADIKASYFQCAKIEFLLWKHSPCRHLLPALHLPYVRHKSPDPQIPIATSCLQNCASLFPLTRNLTLNPLQSWWYFCWLIISFGFLGWDSQDVHGVIQHWRVCERNETLCIQLHRDFGESGLSY